MGKLFYKEMYIIIEEKELTDSEKLLALALIFELYKNNHLSKHEFEKIKDENDDFLKKNNVNFCI